MLVRRHLAVRLQRAVRQFSGHEIDLIIEAGGDTLVPVEVKSGQTFQPNYVKELDWWRNVSGLTGTPGTVLYGGDPSTRYKDHHILSWRGWG